MDSESFITIGLISKPVGIKGKVKVIPLTDFPEKFNHRKKIFLFDEKSSEFFKHNDSFEFNVSNAEVKGNNVSLKLEGINSIEEAEKLRNLLIQIKEAEREELDPDIFYFYELIGCRIYDKNEYAGEIISVENYGGDDLLNMKTENKNIYIPLRKEFIKKIDIKNKRVDADLVEGFLE